MATRFITPDTVEQALELLDARLLWSNLSTDRPRGHGWKIAGGRMRHYVEDAYENNRVGGEGWWKTDFAYLAED